jgi:hypothetical protein
MACSAQQQQQQQQQHISVVRVLNVCSADPVLHYTTAARVAVTWLPTPFFITDPLLN